MKIIFYIIFLLICFILGISFVIFFTPFVGYLDIDKNGDLKDVLLLDFKIPPEEIVEKRDRSVVMLIIRNKSQIDHVSK